MKKSPDITTFTPGRGCTQEDWDEVSDNPEWTQEEIKSAKPFAEVFTDLYAPILRGRGQQKAETKVRVTLRLARSTVDAFKATGPGWQTRIDAALKGVAPGQKSSA